MVVVVINCTSVAVVILHEQISSWARSKQEQNTKNIYKTVTWVLHMFSSLVCVRWVFLLCVSRLRRRRRLLRRRCHHRECYAADASLIQSVQRPAFFHRACCLPQWKCIAHSKFAPLHNENESLYTVSSTHSAESKRSYRFLIFRRKYHLAKCSPCELSQPI